MLSNGTLLPAMRVFVITMFVIINILNNRKNGKLSCVIAAVLSIIIWGVLTTNIVLCIICSAIWVVYLIVNAVGVTLFGKERWEELSSGPMYEDNDWR